MDDLVGLGGSETAMLVMVCSGRRLERPARHIFADLIEVRQARMAWLRSLTRGRSLAYSCACSASCQGHQPGLSTLHETVPDLVSQRHMRTRFPTAGP